MTSTIEYLLVNHLAHEELVVARRNFPALPGHSPTDTDSAALEFWSEDLKHADLSIYRRIK